MTRLPDHERIFAARRAAALERLVGEGIPRPWAEAWIAGWERWADNETREYAHDSAVFWDKGFNYARDEYAVGRRPPSGASARPAG